MAENSTDYDVIIIGGGPAGFSASLWCAELGLKSILFEKENEFGGQLLWTFNAIKNYLGIEAANGRELRDRFLQHIENNDVRRQTGASVVSADLALKTVTLADGKSFTAKAIIIATGVRRRKLEVPGEEEFHGKGILESGVKAIHELSGKTVVIVGGGDAALENAFILSKVAEKVVVIHRRSQFTARNEFVESAQTHKHVEFVFDSRVTAIIGDNMVKAVEIEDIASGRQSTIPTDAVLIRIGVAPNTEPFHGQIALDSLGYILVDSTCVTNLEGIYAAGDVANPLAPTINTAAGNGATSVKQIYINIMPG